MLKKEKKEAIEKFLDSKADDLEDLKEKFKEKFLNKVIPKNLGKRILISHSSNDKNAADKIYYLLLACGFDPKEIIYTSASGDNSDLSGLPAGENIFKYIKNFFIQDWYDNPFVFFVLSERYEKSWWAVLEAGATWVTRFNHSILSLEGYTPQDPLNENKHLYLKSINQDNKDDIRKVFTYICEKLGQQMDEKQFDQKLTNIIKNS